MKNLEHENSRSAKILSNYGRYKHRFSKFAVGRFLTLFVADARWQTLKAEIVHSKYLAHVAEQIFFPVMYIRGNLSHENHGVPH